MQEIQLNLSLDYFKWLLGTPQVINTMVFFFVVRLIFKESLKHNTSVIFLKDHLDNPVQKWSNAI